MPTEILGYFSERDFCLVSPDEFRPRGDGTLDLVPETFFFLVSSKYRTLSALVILGLPFSLQDR